MKKLLFGIMVVISAMLFTSCEKVDFTFQFDVTGYVNDTANTGIVSEFNANVGNEQLGILALGQELESLDADTKEAKSASAWVDDYTVNFIQRNFGKGALYSVHVKGYVKEAYTGIIFAVDRVISNNDALASRFVSVAPEVDSVASEVETIEVAAK